MGYPLVTTNCLCGWSRSHVCTETGWLAEGPPPVDAPAPSAPIGTAAAERREALCRKACEQCSGCDTCVLAEVQA